MLTKLNQILFKGVEKTIVLPLGERFGVHNFTIANWISNIFISIVLIRLLIDAVVIKKVLENGNFYLMLGEMLSAATFSFLVKISSYIYYKNYLLNKNELEKKSDFFATKLALSLCILHFLILFSTSDESFKDWSYGTITILSGVQWITYALFFWVLEYIPADSKESLEEDK